MRMVRYQYVDEISPPAPFVYLTVRNPEHDLASPEMPALLDSGADRTVIPGKLVTALRLSALRTMLVGGLGNDPHQLFMYSVVIQMRTLQSMEVEVIAHDDESFVLLGRDVLNQLRIVLDGPNQVLEIG